MGHRIEAEHDQEGASSATVSLRPVAAPSALRSHPAAAPAPARAPQETPPAARKPIWDKDNFGFWLAVCVAISLVFSLVYHTLA
jgi:hypothetical protein